jgi:DHA1 family inner membrane transport protein
MLPVVPALTPRERGVLWLLALAQLPYASANTIFTQTVSWVADDFGASDAAIGVAAAVVRWGVVLALPVAILGDRAGRRRAVLAAAWLAPVLTALGALAPGFAWLTASQVVARPMALALSVVCAVIATEEMGDDSRALALGLLAIAAGVGAGTVVALLPIAEWRLPGLGAGWRAVYLASLVWLVVPLVLQRRLHETRRFEAHAAEAPVRLQRGRLAAQATVAVLGNVFIAGASVFLVNYLRDARGFDAARVSLFTLVTASPAAIGLVAGGRLADRRGRRVLGAASLAIGTLCFVAAYLVSGAPMWAAALVGGVALGVAYPATGVYRGEMFATRRRGTASGLVTTASLLGGSAGLLVAGLLLDRGAGYGEVMALLALGPLAASVVVLVAYPETAHRALEDLNPGDAAGSAGASGSAGAGDAPQSSSAP